MALTRNDDYLIARVQTDAKFARLMRETATELLGGNEEDRWMAVKILKVGFGFNDEEIQALVQKEAAA